MAIKYTICVMLMIKLKVCLFFDRIFEKKMKRGQSQAQQQYIQGFFKFRLFNGFYL